MIMSFILYFSNMLALCKVIASIYVRRQRSWSAAIAQRDKPLTVIDKL